MIRASTNRIDGIQISKAVKPLLVVSLLLQDGCTDHSKSGLIWELFAQTTSGCGLKKYFGWYKKEARVYVGVSLVSHKKLHHCKMWRQENKKIIKLNARQIQTLLIQCLRVNLALPGFVNGLEAQSLVGEEQEIGLGDGYITDDQLPDTVDHFWN